MWVSSLLKLKLWRPCFIRTDFQVSDVLNVLSLDIKKLLIIINPNLSPLRFKYYFLRFRFYYSVKA